MAKRTSTTTPVVETEVTPEVVVDTAETVVPDEVVTPEEVDSEPTDTVVAPEELKSVNEVMLKAATEDGLDKTIVDVPEEDDIVEDTPVAGDIVDVTDIIKNDNLSLLEKIDAISAVLPPLASKLVKSAVSLYHLGSTANGRQPEKMNREQKIFVRTFIKLANEPTTVFNENMKYFSWVFKQLSDVKVLEANNLVLFRGESPLEQSTSTLFIAGKNDSELNTFLYLINILDLKINSATAAERNKQVATDKITVNTNFTEELINKINNAFSVNN